MKQDVVVRSVMKLALVTIVGFTVACSSSGSSDDDNSVDTSISGNVVAAPVDGASVIVKDATGINELAGPVPTTIDGGYSIDPGSASSGAYIIESSGGTYKDEASGDTVEVGTHKLKAYVDGANLAAGSQVHLTPASTIIHDLVVIHKVELSKALSDFESTFGFAGDSDVAPADATSPAADATNEELLAGLGVAAFSQLTRNLSLSPVEQFDLLAALAEDLADGSLNGMKDTAAVSITVTKMLPADIQNLFSQAFIDFHSSVKDKTGLDNNVISAVVPFARVALTDNYKVEYVTEAMPMMGKTQFTVRVSHNGGGVADGLSVSMAPMMHMPENRNHSTPMLGCTENMGTPGDYDCTLYYLMPSADRGYWELAIDIAGDVATFYPQVMMDMGARVVFKDFNDGNEATMERSYILFKENFAETEDEFTMYFVFMKNMMEFPAVGTELSTMSGLVPVIVQVSTAANPTVDDDWADDLDWDDVDGNSEDGFWVAPITGFMGKIHVRLIVGGVQKSTDGQPLGESVDPDTLEPIVNEYATFMLMTTMPGM